MAYKTKRKDKLVNTIRLDPNQDLSNGVNDSRGFPSSVIAPEADTAPKAPSSTNSKYAQFLMGEGKNYPYADYYKQMEKNAVIANTPEAPSSPYNPLDFGKFSPARYAAKTATASKNMPSGETANGVLHDDDKYAEWYKKNGTEKVSQEDYDTMQGVTRDYAEYARRMGVPEAKAQAESDYSRALSGYGVKAEQMAQAGIHGGYGDYLDYAAYAEMQRAKENAEQTARKGYAEQIAGADAGYAQYAYGVDQQNKADYKAYQAGEEAKTVLDDQYKQYLMASGMTEEEANAAVVRARSVAGNLDSEGYASYLDTSASIAQSKKTAEVTEAQNDYAIISLYSRLTEGTTTDKDGNEMQGWTLQNLSDKDYKAAKEQLTTELSNLGYTEAQINGAFDRVDRLRAQNEKTLNDYKEQAHETIQQFASGNATADDVISELGITMPEEPKKIDYIDVKTGEFRDRSAQAEYEKKAEEYKTQAAIAFLGGLNDAVESGAITNEDRSATICKALPMYDENHTGQDVYDSVRSAYTNYEIGWITDEDMNKVYDRALSDYVAVAQTCLGGLGRDGSASLTVKDGKLVLAVDGTPVDAGSVAMGYRLLKRAAGKELWSGDKDKVEHALSVISEAQQVPAYYQAAKFAAEKVKTHESITYKK